MAPKQYEIPAPKMGGSLTQKVRVLCLGKRLSANSRRQSNIMWIPEEVAWRKTKAYRLLDPADIAKFAEPAKAASKKKEA